MYILSRDSDVIQIRQQTEAFSKFKEKYTYTGTRIFLVGKRMRNWKTGVVLWGSQFMGPIRGLHLLLAKGTLDVIIQYNGRLFRIEFFHLRKELGHTFSNILETSLATFRFCYWIEFLFSV